MPGDIYRENLCNYDELSEAISTNSGSIFPYRSNTKHTRHLPVDQIEEFTRRRGEEGLEEFTALLVDHYPNIGRSVQMSNTNNGKYSDPIPVEQTGSGLNKPIKRREFLVATGVIGGGLFLTAQGVFGKTTAQDVFPANALGMVIGDSTRCVGCRRCELACSEFNDGKSQPSIARIKVGRNYNFGPSGAQVGLWREEGRFGNHRLIQDSCRQCPHPVPCQMACPYGAIEVIAPVNARVINTDKCQGCRTCQKACPWGMTSFDEEVRKATKCHLCNGDPECVKACPAGALRYVPWDDRTKDIPARFIVPAYIETPADVKATCGQCH
jgi:Fe-S-cluster-containing dehydrogenase component